MTIAVKNPTEIAIGHRIGEILEERGSAFSIRAFSARIGMSKDMLARMIAGDRYISPSELKLIADGLSLSVARLKQEDTNRYIEEVAMLLENDEKFDRVLQIATELKKVAVGCTERFFVSDAIGKAYYLSMRFEDAHEAWLEAKHYAEMITHRYGNTDHLYRVMHNLVLSFSERKDFAGLKELVQKLNPVFEGFPRRLATLYYSTAAAALHVGNYIEARENFLRSLERMQEFGRVTDIAIAEHNVAHTEYMLGNYEIAKSYHERVISKLDNLEEFLLIAYKDYTKTLLKLGEVEQARSIVLKCLLKVERLNLPLRRAQFLMLHAIVNEDPNSAEQVLLYEEIPNDLKRLACRFLMNYFMRIGDAVNLMRYYGIAESYRDDVSAIYDEMGL